MQLSFIEGPLGLARFYPCFWHFSLRAEALGVGLSFPADCRTATAASIIALVTPLVGFAAAVRLSGGWEAKRLGL